MCSSRATSLTRRESFGGSIPRPSGSSATFAVASSLPSSHPRTGRCPRAIRSEDARHLRGQRGDRPPRLKRRDAGARGGERGGAQGRRTGGRRLRADRGPPDDSATAPPPHLTPRQVEVLRLLEQGRSTKQIAAELHLSTETVRNHVRRSLKPSVSTPGSRPSPPPGGRPLAPSRLARGRHRQGDGGGSGPWGAETLCGTDGSSTAGGGFPNRQTDSSRSFGNDPFVSSAACRPPLP